MEFNLKLGYLIFILTCLSCWSIQAIDESSTSRLTDLDGLIRELEQKVFSYQAREEKKYIPPFRW